MADAIIAKLFDLLQASDKVGFALFFAGCVVFTGQAYGLWPFTLLQESLGWVLFVTLTGAGLLIWRFLAWTPKVARQIWQWARRRRFMNSAPDRVNQLMRYDRICLCWIALHPDKEVSGDPRSAPFISLVRQGFVTRTDVDFRKQAFKVNPRVYAETEKITKGMTPQERQIAEQDYQPWEIRLPFLG